MLRKRYVVAVVGPVVIVIVFALAMAALGSG